MKRRWILLLSALMACAIFAGCANAPAPTGTGGQDPVQVPIYGDRIKDGAYPIEVSSSSSMFRIVDAQLTVKDGKMSALLTLSGTGYGKLYMGTGEEALKVTEDKYSNFVKNSEDKYTYEVPVEALDKEVDCAAWSIKYEKWYDRVLVFQSSLIPKDAIAELPADGQYTIAAALSGGSGRATVESPARLTVKDGAMTAVIVWSSPNYDFMLVNGTKYDPVNTQGNSTFEIPVSRLDKDIAVSAETTAMSAPHVVDYTLRFDSSTLKAAGGFHQTAVIIAASAVVLAAVVLTVILLLRKRKRKPQNEQ